MTEHFELLFSLHGEAWSEWFSKAYEEALKAANCSDLAEWSEADMAGMLAFFKRSDFLTWLGDLPEASNSSKRL